MGSVWETFDASWEHISSFSGAGVLIENLSCVLKDDQLLPEETPTTSEMLGLFLRTDLRGWIYIFCCF